MFNDSRTMNEEQKVINFKKVSIQLKIDKLVENNENI